VQQKKITIAAAFVEGGARKKNILISGDGSSCQTKGLWKLGSDFLEKGSRKGAMEASRNKGLEKSKEESGATSLKTSAGKGGGECQL